MTEIVEYLLAEFRQLRVVPDTTERVLVADDDDGFRELLKKVLSKPGVVVEVVDTVDKAIAAVEASVPFKRVYLDLNFNSQKTGLMVLGRFRSLFPDVPVTAVSGFVDDERFEAEAARLNCQLFRKGRDNIMELA
jgi:CheY-like chemotaxis protein